MIPVTFNQIQVGKNFSVASGIVYQKVSLTESKPIKDSKGVTISNGRISSSFYNTKMLLIPLN